jgi:UDP-N-acetyl-D-mannosaminuronic acid transferase (WecB/TagA/CpsF family)
MLTADSTTSKPDHTERVLGVSFFNGSVSEAVERIQRMGGYMVAPVSPALIKLNYDQEYRRALQEADVAIADSGLLVILWKFATGRKLAKLSGLSYLKGLLARGGIAQSALWVVSSDTAKTKAVDWLREGDSSLGSDNVYVVAQTAGSAEHYALLIEIEARRPSNIVIAVGGGAQEKLALYLRDYLLYRPAIHCVGAALGFLTGDEKPIPEWADRFYLGWMIRLLSQPRMLIPRLWVVFELTSMVFKFRSELPPLRSHWADV